jgi:hypothetical protein
MLNMKIEKGIMLSWPRSNNLSGLRTAAHYSYIIYRLNPVAHLHIKSAHNMMIRRVLSSSSSSLTAHAASKISAGLC